MKQQSLLDRIISHSTLFIGLGVIMILVIMLIPLPTILIDVFLTINFSLAFIVLLTPIYIEKPTDISVYPGLLLVITLFRLALNIATTRLILGQADAGKVIDVFGSFVIKGNYVVGLIIFAILVIINFMVITKGASRVAEVTARFTLDSLPGKQMSIDADLNNGVIDEAEARERRTDVRKEADFYGAMDGAAKFVKGDATAGIIIMLLNILGGIIIGMVQLKMPFMDAVQRYTVLTVGDGLVAQIPAILISTSAGLIVTRAGTKADLGEEFFSQLFSDEKVLFISAIVIGIFGFLPGMPWYIFIFISLGLASLGYYLKKNPHVKKEEKEKAEKEEELQMQEPTLEEQAESFLKVDPLEIELGYSLISLVDEDKSGDLLDRISNLRKQIATEVGILIPPIRVRDNISAVPNQYSVKIRGESIASGECLINHLLALDSGEVEKKIKGIETEDPAFGLPSLWITPDKKDLAEMHGYTVIEPDAMIVTHVSEVIKTNADQIITRQDVKELLEQVKKYNAAVVEELVPDLLSLGNIEKIMKNLLHERVPVKDMVTILETLADYATVTKDIETLTEYVRFNLARTIAKPFISSDGCVYGITISGKLEQIVTDVVNKVKRQNVAATVPPQIVSQLYSDIKEAVDAMNKQGLEPLLLVSPTIRSYMKRLIEPVVSSLAVLSFNEIPTDIPIQTNITIDLEK